MNRKQTQARQGDIFFEVVDGPSEAALKKNQRHETPVLAHGEVTGHTHAIATPHISQFQSYVDPDNGHVYVKSATQMSVDHDEHDTITMPKDEWIKISRQREYDPLSAEKERQVRD